MRAALRQILSSDPIDQWARGSIHAWDFLNGTARFNYGRVGRATSTPGWSYTRADSQNAYAQTPGGVLVPFATGQLRRIDGRGVLIEGARTNLLLRTTLEGGGAVPTGWTQPTATGTSTAGTSSINADVVAYTHVGSAERPFFAQTVTLATNTTYTLSVYIEAVTGTIAAADMLNAVSLPSGANATGDGLGNLAAGTRRTVTISGTYTGGTAQIRVGLGTSANATGTVRFSMPQLEAASFPSSYIPTTTASATRAADVLTVPVSGIANPLSLYAEFERAVDTGGAEHVLSIYVGGAGDSARLYVSASDTGATVVKTGGASQADLAAGAAIAIGSIAKLAARYSTNNVQAARGGTLGTQDSSVTVPPTPTTLQFGSDGSNPCFGYLRRAALFTRALSDSELTAVTS